MSNNNLDHQVGGLYDSFKLVSYQEMRSRSVHQEWIIDELIPAKSTGMIFGPSGCGKSFVALSMALSVASCKENWFSKKVISGNVVFLAGEGHEGIPRRIQALDSEFGVNEFLTKNFDFSEYAIGLDSPDSLNKVIEALDQLDEKPDLIFVDTLSRHLNYSDENSNVEMARFINNVDVLKQRYGCTVVLIHHTGKGNQKVARGASAIKANIDFSFSVMPKEGSDKGLVMTCDKQKDGDDNVSPMHFRIKKVHICIDDSGKDVFGACIVLDDSSAGSFNKPISTSENLAIQCFRPNRKEWQEVFLDASTDEAKLESKKKRFREVLKGLIEKGVVREKELGSYEIAT